MPKILFHPGDVMATADALRAMEFNEVTPQLLLRRHVSGDWGELPARERRKNELRALTERGSCRESLSSERRRNRPGHHRPERSGYADQPTG